jgi:hypothetical protein
VAVIAVKTQNGYVVQRFGGSFLFSGKGNFQINVYNNNRQREI